VKSGYHEGGRLTPQSSFEMAYACYVHGYYSDAIAMAD
jgi:hypothetical protein